MKKRILALALSLILILSQMPFTALAGDWTTGAPDITLTASELGDDNTFSVTVTIGTSSEAVRAYNFGVVYDPALVEPDTTKGDCDKDKFVNDDEDPITVGIATTVSTVSDNFNFKYANIDGDETMFFVTDARDKGFTTKGFTMTFFFKLKEAAIANGGLAEFWLNQNKFEVGTGEDAISVPPSTKVSVAIPMKSAALTGTVTTPTKGGTDASSVTSTNTNVDIAISWSPALEANKFAANTQYKATVTVSPKTGCAFADDFAVTGLSDYTFAKDSNGNYVAEKTFEKTADKSITALTVTTAPTKTEYTHGDTFDSTGMVIKAEYDDSSVDNAFAAYTVSYQNGSFLKAGDTAVTVSAGTVTVSQPVTVAKKELSIIRLEATNRPYDGTTTIVLTGGELTGVVSGDDAKVAIPTSGTIASANAGSSLAVTVTKPSVTGADATYYTLADLPALTADVSKVGLTITAKDKSITYGDAAANDGYTITGFVNSETESVITGSVAYSYGTYAAGSDVGDYEIVPDITGLSADNYTFKAVNGKLTVAAKTVTATIDPIESQTYTGSEIKPTVTVKDSTTVIDPAEYTVTYSNNVKAGTNTATVTITDKEGGNYNVSGSTTFTINPKDISATDVNYPINIVNGVGTFAEPAPKDGDVAITGSVVYGTNDYAAQVAELKALSTGATGTFNYTFTASGNYTGTVTGTFTYTVVDIIFKVGTEAASETNAVTEKADAVYGDTWADLVTLDKTIVASVDTTTGEGTYSLDKILTDIPAAGTQAYKVLFTGTVGGKDYTNVEVFSGTIEIAPKELTVEDGTYAITKVYDTTTAAGSSSGELTLKGVLEGDTVKVTVGTVGVYDDANAGTTHEVALSDLSLDNTNYTVAKDYTFKKAAITAKEVTAPTIELLFDPATVSYTGSAIEAKTVTVKDSTTVIDPAEYTVTYSDNMDAGTNATVTITDKEGGNYNVSGSKTFTINPKDISATGVNYPINVVNGVGTFAEPAPKDGNVDIPGSVVYGTNDYAAQVAELKALSTGATGTFNYTFTASGNYTGTVTGTFTYTVVDIIFKVGTEAASETNAVTEKADAVYGDTWADLVKLDKEIIAFVDTTTGTGTCSLDKDATDIPAAGTQAYKVLFTGTVGGKDYTNVEVFSGTIEIAPKELTVTDGTYAITKEFDNTTAAGTASGDLALTGLLDADKDNVKVTVGTIGTYAKTDAGDAYTVELSGLTLTGTGKENYKLEVATYNFTKAAITVKELLDTDFEAVASVDWTEKNEPEPALVAGSIFTADDYTVAYDDNVNAGTGKIVITGTKNATGTVTLNFTINAVAATFDGELTAYGTYTNATASWKVKDGGKPDDLNYKAEAYELDANGDKVDPADPIIGTVNGTTASFDGLTTGTKYTIEITVDNGTGTPVTKSVEVTPFIPYTPPTPAEPAEPDEPEETFKFEDVDDDAWYAEFVYDLYERGIVNGISETEFQPDRDITRAEFVKILAGAVGADVSGYTGSAFEDVPENEWYAPYVAWAVEAGVTNGYGTIFDPTSPITREQMAAMIYRYCQKNGIILPETVEAVAFDDSADFADWSAEAIAAMQKAGIISGIGNNLFAPQADATRGQACKMISILIGILEAK